MKVILKENIEKLGFKDEIVDVKNGFARNFLIPKNKAVIATENAIKVLNEKLRQQESRLNEEIESANRRAHLIWCKQLRWNRGGITAGNCISPCLRSDGHTKQNT